MTLQLELIRHADALPKVPGGSDHDRALSPLGERQVLIMGERLRERAGYPDRVWCSTARRTRQTLAGLGYDFTSIATYLDRLYETELEVLLDFIAEVRGLAGRIMIVSHNPGLQDLLTWLVGPDVPEMRTATYVRIQVPDRPARPLRGKGRLLESFSP
jgi:phosphohistidine phosphatase